jgi:hypothetical protein
MRCIRPWLHIRLGYTESLVGGCRPPQPNKAPLTQWAGGVLLFAFKHAPAARVWLVSDSAVVSIWLLRSDISSSRRRKKSERKGATSGPNLCDLNGRRPRLRGRRQRAGKAAPSLSSPRYCGAL